MRAIRLEEPRHFVHVDVPFPEAPGRGQALVRTHRMGICGTDLAGFLGKMPFFRYPRIPGHELGVEVLAVGPGVTQVKTGDRCSVEPYMNCGECYACRHERGNCCERLNVIGVMVDGGLCEQFLIRADKLHPSEVLSYEQLALVETLAIGCHATDRGAPVKGERALIIGAGPIGLSVLEFTRLTGAEVTVMDMNEDRLRFCREVYGVPHTILFRGDGSELEEMRRMTNGDRFAVVTDATGSNRSMANALHFVAQTGRLVYVGITTGEVTFPHPWMHRPEATMLASRNAMPGDFRRIIGLIEDGTINTGPWITHHVEYNDLVRDFEMFTRPETGAIKAIVHVTA
ncbi:zinc-binding alcohol dehydrogenase family protein [Planctomicrobium piriforme]|uniref:Alcohol dehydrogenase n=1 Tax=Planctomicrobium piriforme TaxID=1576369 RepID=A0A1I3HHY9_9PLAN|nr:zinc-binding alcohol dehydrogenase family protein [Planctomicrobium piriforme]SFI35239.1 alcohol dehydrogenase [Planctomicrobium piriforme]